MTKLHIVPTLGKRALGAVRRSDIDAWATALDLAPSTVATARQYLGQILTVAVEDGLIARSPATGARMPRNDAPRPDPVHTEVLARSRTLCPHGRVSRCRSGSLSGSDRVRRRGWRSIACSSSGGRCASIDSS